MVMMPPATSTQTTGTLRQLSTASADCSRSVTLVACDISRSGETLAIGELQQGDDRDHEQEGEGGGRAEADVVGGEGQLVHVEHHDARRVAWAAIGEDAHRLE